MTKRYRLTQRMEELPMYCDIGKPMAERYFALISTPGIGAIPVEQRQSYQQLKRLKEHTDHCECCAQAFGRTTVGRTHSAKLAAPIDIRKKGQ